MKIFPDMESLVSDVPVGDGEIAKKILQCINTALSQCWLLRQNEDMLMFGAHERE